MTEPIAPSGKYEITVSGAPLDAQQDSRLVRIEVDQRINAPAAFELAFRDETMDIPADVFRVGNAVEISLHSEAHGGTRKLISGEITTVEQELAATGGVFTVLRGMAKGHRLFRQRKTRVFTEQTHADIVSRVARDAGLTPEVASTPVTHPVVTQPGVTDWELISALAREVGMEVLLDGDKLKLRKPPAAADSGPKLTWGENLKELRSVVTAAAVPTGVQVRGWDPVTKAAVVATATPAAVGASFKDTPATLASPLGDADWVAAGTAYAQQGSADAAAKSAADELGSTCVELHGIAVGDAKLAAGEPITLEGVGEGMSGSYVLTSVRHVYAAEGAYLTEFTVSGRADRSLHGLVSGANGHTRGSSGGPAIHGVVVAIVTNNKDPDDLSRVKVTYPWLSDDCESHWARMALPMAGNGYGASFLPEVNDEVLVAFDHGDIDRPYVLGVLYNGKDVPKHSGASLVDSAGKVLVRGLETPGHHRLEFFEQGGDQDAVVLTTGDDKFSLHLDKQNTTIRVTSEGTVEIDAQQDITVKTPGNFDLEAQKITLTAQNGATIDAGAGPAEMKSAVKASVEGTQLELKGSAKADLNGGAMTTVKGAIVQIN